jgi:hypothetical protein
MASKKLRQQNSALAGFAMAPLTRQARSKTNSVCGVIWVKVKLNSLGDARMRPLLLFSLLLLVGCGQSTPSPVDLAASSEGLAGLARSTNRQLQTELALLVQEKATPGDIDRAIQATWPKGEDGSVGALSSQKSPSQDAGTFIAGLNDIFSPFERSALFEEAKGLWPKGEFRFAAVDLEAVREFNLRHAEKRQQLRELLHQEPPLGHLPSHGFASDYAFLDAATLAHHVEGFTVAESLAAGQPEQSLESLDAMFFMARLLDQGQDITTRLAAARMRQHTLRVVEAVANHARADAALRRRLADVINAQTSHWADEAATLRGERAAGLEVYEMVRRGEVASLLSGDQFEQAAREFKLQALCRSVERNVDQDELFYLTAMRRLIDNAGQPFYQRQATLDELRTQLGNLVDTPDDPFIARTMLLIDLETSLRLMAEDRARCEAWQLALTESDGVDGPDFEIDPLAGEPYDIEQRSDAVIVRFNSGKEAASVRK